MAVLEALLFHICTDKTCLRPELPSAVTVYVHACTHGDAHLNGRREEPGVARASCVTTCWGAGLGWLTVLCCLLTPCLYLSPWQSQYKRMSSPAGMESPLLLLLLAWLTVVTKVKVFNQELAHMLQEDRLDGYKGYSIANCEFQSPVCPQPFLLSCCSPHWWQLWHSLSAFCPCPGLCMVTFNTAAQSIKDDYSSADYGISQIGSQLWCTNDSSHSDNRYRMTHRGKNHSTAPPEPAPGVTAAAQTLLPCPNSPLLWPKRSHGGMSGPPWTTRCLWPQEVGGDEWLGPAPLSVCAGYR